MKLTSLGDLIHALPALSDAKRAHPDIVFDWMIDAHFQEVALWHPAVRRIFPTNHRQWRWRQWGSWRKLLTEVRRESYDFVIDGQGNFKTALLSLFMRGVRVGFDKHSVRERVAHLAYQKKCSASRKVHAIERLRRLLASALDYPLPLSPPDFQIQQEKFQKPPIELPEKFFVFIHSASWKSKLWPESHWKELIRLCSTAKISPPWGTEEERARADWKELIRLGSAAKISPPWGTEEERARADWKELIRLGSAAKIFLPWGTEEERARAERLGAEVLPKLTLNEMGYLLSRATGCVSMDTGFSHLAAALGIPCVTLYGSTDSGLTGANGESQLHLRSELFCSPCHKKTCRYTQGDSPCLAAISPEQVYRELLRQASLRYL